MRMTRKFPSGWTRCATTRVRVVEAAAVVVIVEDQTLEVATFVTNAAAVEAEVSFFHFLVNAICLF